MFRIDEHLDRYINGEWHPRGELSVKGPCQLLGELSGHDQLYATLYLASALKKAGAMEIELLAPYLPYLRQDHTDRGDIGAALLGSLMGASGITKIRTLDPHSEAAKKLLAVPCATLSAFPELYEHTKEDGRNINIIIAPDAGAHKRLLATSPYLEDDVHVITASKEHRESTVHVSLEETPRSGSDIAIVDDMLDTGRTIISTVQALLSSHPKSITIIITHGLFSGDAWRGLLEVPNIAIYCTDSHPSATRAAREHQGIIHALPALPLLLE